MSKTFIPGKDSALEDTLSRIQSGLAALNIHPQISQESNPVDQVWSVHLKDTSTGLYTNGKGTTLMAAQASAWAEFCERLGTGYFFAPLYLGPEMAAELHSTFVFDAREQFVKDAESMLSAELWQIYDPDKSFRKSLKKDPALLSILTDAHTGSGTAGDFTGVLCLPFSTLAGDETVNFPLNLIWNLYASNGLSAGNTVLEARIQGLSEIMERHVKYRIIGESLCLPDIPSSHWSPKASLAIKGIVDAGFKLVVKDASLGGVFPVVTVALIHPKSGEVLLSFGSHPDFQVALERTVTELFQGRPLAHSEEFSAPCADPELLADPGNLENHFINSTGLVPMRFFAAEPDFAFTPWVTPANREAEYQRMLDILAGLKVKAYIREKLCCGVQTCQILVPGFSEIYPMEEAWEANTSRFQPLRAFIVQGPGLDDETLEACVQIVETEFSGTAGNQQIADLIGIDLAGSAWEGLGTSEMSALVFLAAKDAERLGDFLAYEMDWASLPRDRRGFWRAINGLLQDEDHTMELLHDADQVKVALASLSGHWPAAIYPVPGPDLSGLPAHRNLQALYRNYLAI